MREYKMMMSKNAAELFDAVLKQQYHPSEENKKRVEELSAKAYQRAVEDQRKREVDFISLYGQDIFDFVKSISKENFLSFQSRPYSLSWEIKWDSENDDYWSVSFFKGHFSYVKDICGGYGGREILELNIPFVRVKELLASKQQS